MRRTQLPQEVVGYEEVGCLDRKQEDSLFAVTGGESKHLSCANPSHPAAWAANEPDMGPGASALWLFRCEWALVVKKGISVSPLQGLL